MLKCSTQGNYRVGGVITNMINDDCINNNGNDNDDVLRWTFLAR